MKGDDCLEPIGNWCRLSSGWTRNRPVAREDFGLATYKRSQNASSSVLTRVLIYGGIGRSVEMTDSWIYCIGTNSWTPAMLPKSSRGEISGLFGNWRSGWRGTLTTICLTKIILLRLNFDPWVFDGAREEWVPVLLSSPVSPSVYAFSVSAVPREKTPCHCKESVFVYGGRNADTGAWSKDLWELRCVDDSDVLRYQWMKVPKKSPASLWPPTIVSPISFSIKAEMYVLGGYANSSSLSGRIEGVWKFDINTSTWTFTETPPFNFNWLQTAGFF